MCCLSELLSVAYKTDCDIYWNLPAFKIFFFLQLNGCTFSPVVIHSWTLVCNKRQLSCWAQCKLTAIILTLTKPNLSFPLKHSFSNKYIVGAWINSGDVKIQYFRAANLGFIVWWQHSILWKANKNGAVGRPSKNRIKGCLYLFPKASDPWHPGSMSYN